MPLEDVVRLRHMLEAAEQIGLVVSEMNREQLGKDWITTMGLRKALEVIGEAAARISPECRTRHPQVPWADIVGMRNRLVHGYFDIDLDIVWRAVTEEVPTLMTQLRAIIEEES